MYRRFLAAGLRGACLRVKCLILAGLARRLDTEEMDLDVVWVLILASLVMGLAGVSLFIYAVKKDYFRNLEDVKYQVFWSDLEELVESSREQKDDEHGSKKG